MAVVVVVVAAAIQNPFNQSAFKEIRHILPVF
jgi:hypothetical protein